MNATPPLAYRASPASHSYTAVRISSPHFLTFHSLPSLLHWNAPKVTIPPCQNHVDFAQSSPPLTPQDNLILLVTSFSLKHLLPLASMTSRNSPGLNPTSMTVLSLFFCRLILFYTTSKWQGPLRLNCGLSPLILCPLLRQSQPCSWPQSWAHPWSWQGWGPDHGGGELFPWWWGKIGVLLQKERERGASGWHSS